MFILSIVAFVTIPKDKYAIGLLFEEKHLIGESTKPTNWHFNNALKFCFALDIFAVSYYLYLR